MCTHVGVDSSMPSVSLLTDGVEVCCTPPHGKLAKPFGQMPSCWDPMHTLIGRCLHLPINSVHVDSTCALLMLQWPHHVHMICMLLATCNIMHTSCVGVHFMCMWPTCACTCWWEHIERWISWDPKDGTSFECLMTSNLNVWEVDCWEGEWILTLNRLLATYWCQ